MSSKKIMVRVNASFEKGKDLFGWLKRYAKNNDEHFLYWDEFAFTTEDRPECDALLIFNNPSEKIETLCYPENVIAFMMEPGIYSEHRWMFKGLEHYSTVYSPLKNSPNTVLSNGFLGWHLSDDWDRLSCLGVPEKKLKVSCIASNLTKLKGHRRRMIFLELLKKEVPSIDFFGRGSNYIPNKLAGLLPYRFSIAVENTSAPYYFTEKIGDCFLAWTVPVYYGCKNIGHYFPERSFIQIDIDEPEQAVKKIRQVMEKNDWEERLPALQEARDLVLNKYQPLAGAASVLRNRTTSSARKKIVLRPVPEGIEKKIRNFLSHLITKSY